MGGRAVFVFVRSPAVLGRWCSAFPPFAQFLDFVPRKCRGRVKALALTLESRSPLWL